MKLSNWQAKENRLLSDLWLMSAATFRRLGKIEQAKGAIQEAEVKDEGNPNVWVQVYFCSTLIFLDNPDIDWFEFSLDCITSLLDTVSKLLMPFKKH